MEERLSLTGTEVSVVLREIERELPLRVKKVYQLSPELFSITVYGGETRDLIVWIEGAVYISRYRWEKPPEPTPLAMGLRKWIQGGIIQEVGQLNLDRVLWFDVEAGGERRRLYVELFGGGNLVLTDDEGTILHLARPLKVRDRELRRGLKYTPPIARSIGEVERGSVRGALLSGIGEYVWRVVIERLSLGPPYLDEACRAAGVDPRSRLSEDLVDPLTEACLSLLTRFNKPRPVIYRDPEGREVNFAAFPLESLRETLEEVPGHESFQATIDSYLSPKLVEGEAEGPSPLETEIERQRALLREYEERERELVRKAEFIFSRLGEIEELLSRIRRGDVPRGVEVDWRTGEVRVEVNGISLELNMRLGASGSAGRLYERAKTLRRKKERIKVVIGELEERLRRETRRRKKLIPRVKRAWYERFRWFRSSEGFLVVAGKDASTNRELVRRYMGPRDLFFHVDMPGGAVVIVKTEGKTPGSATIEEAGVYAASYSRAWRSGFSTADVYWVWG